MNFRLIVFGAIVVIVPRVSELNNKSLLEQRKTRDTDSVISATLPIRASGPLRTNTLNSRYFTDGSGKAIYLTGSHIWTNLQDRGPTDPPPAFDYIAYLEWLQQLNHNLIRMWVWENAKWAPWTTGDYFFSPLPYQRSGPGTALDGKPKFDLRRFNQSYFDRLRKRVVAAGERGIYVCVMLFQGWSYKKLDKPGDPWRGHPFHKDNNINGINGDPNGDGYGWEVHSLEVPEITEVQKAYVHKVIDTLQDLDNVLYEISNESNPGSVEWQYYMINLIRVYEGTKQKQHPILMSAIEDGWHEKKISLGPADAISPAGGVSGNDPPKADGGRVMISDTDHIFGVGGDHNWVWKSFTRGHNPIYMDPITDPEWEAHRRVRNPEWHLARLAMGHTRAYATRMNLAATEPRTDLCSTAYCLANPGFEYLVYLPFGSHWMERWVELLPHWIESWIDSMSLFSRRVTIDLSGSSETLNVEWFNPRTGDITPAGKTTGGVRRSFRAPFGGDAVLYLYSRN